MLCREVFLFTADGREGNGTQIAGEEEGI